MPFFKKSSKSEKENTDQTSKDAVAKTTKPNRDSLGDLINFPDDVLKIMLTFLSNFDKVNFYETCKYFMYLVKSDPTFKPTPKVYMELLSPDKISPLLVMRLSEREKLKTDDIDFRMSLLSFEKTFQEAHKKNSDSIEKNNLILNTLHLLAIYLQWLTDPGKYSNFVAFKLKKLEIKYAKNSTGLFKSLNTIKQAENAAIDLHKAAKDYFDRKKSP